MGISQTTRQAYSEIDEFLSLLTDEKREQIPVKLREFFKEEKDKNYTKGIKLDIPVKEQNFKEETLAIIAWLNLEYWCQDEEEKERLRKIYDNNEKIYKEMLQVEFKADDVFKKKNVVIENENNEQVAPVSMVEYKESVFKKILNRIKQIFNIK